MIIVNSALIKCRVIAVLQFVLACLILPLFALATLGFLLEPEPGQEVTFGICLAFDALGAWLVYCVIKRIKMLQALKKYSAFLTEESPGVRIVKLAPLVSEKEDTIMKNFQWMIKQGFFKDAYVELETGCVIFHEAYWQAVDKAREVEEEKRASYISVVCVCCGGTSTVVRGKGGACEYCGAPLEA